MRPYHRLFVLPFLIGSILLDAVAFTATDRAPVPWSKAAFAGGCFWCMEPPCAELDGVISTTSGYTGGHKTNRTYEEVSAGTTGHAEAVQVLHDPKKIRYVEPLKVFWRKIDPRTPDRQFCDKGNQYRTTIFYHDAQQKRLAQFKLYKFAWERDQRLAEVWGSS